MTSATVRDLLVELYRDKKFIRISPITGGIARGVVRDILIVNSVSLQDDAVYISPQVNIISTNGISYPLVEVFFESDANRSEYKARLERFQGMRFQMRSIAEAIQEGRPLPSLPGAVLPFDIPSLGDK